VTHCKNIVPSIVFSITLIYVSVDSTVLVPVCRNKIRILFIYDCTRYGPALAGLTINQSTHRTCRYGSLFSGPTWRIDSIPLQKDECIDCVTPLKLAINQSSNGGAGTAYIKHVCGSGTSKKVHPGWGHHKRKNWSVYSTTARYQDACGSVPNYECGSATKNYSYLPFLGSVRYFYECGSNKNKKPGTYSTTAQYQDACGSVPNYGCGSATKNYSNFPFLGSVWYFYECGSENNKKPGTFKPLSGPWYDQQVPPHMRIRPKCREADPYGKKNPTIPAYLYADPS
jgi:hypothetical protein